jgi:hypothetical protein
LIVTTTCAVAAAQGAGWPVEVSVSVTVPAVASPPDGTYVAFSVAALGVNAPEPEVVQVPPVALPPTVPPRGAVPLPAQIVWLPPALAVGALLIVTTTCAVAAAGQGAT